MPEHPLARAAYIVIIVLLLVGLGLLFTQVASVLLLVFAAIVLAVIFHSAAEPLRRMGLSNTLSVTLTVLGIFAVFGLAGWFFGAQISEQVTEIAERVPSGIEGVRDWVETLPFGDRLSSMEIGGSDAVGRVFAFTSTALGAIANLIIVIFGGIYIALAPSRYADGVAALVPHERRPVVRAALSDTWRALRKFLLGQLIAMLSVGLFTGIGLWLVGVPAAFALGLLTGLANFIPTFGPVIAAVPGILIGLTVSPMVALYAAGVYLFLQQVDGNVTTPIIQKRAVALPPALLIFSLLAMGVLFGPLGVIVAAPLTVAVYTLVIVLYCRETLGDDRPIPGNDQGG